MQTNNDLLALAIATNQPDPVIIDGAVYIGPKGCSIKFDPRNNANQCFECWEKLVDGFWDMERSGCGHEIWLRKSATRPRLDVCKAAMLEAMTAAMVQLPAVQDARKGIEG